MKKVLLLFILFSITNFNLRSQQLSVAHQWVSDLLFCIKNDFARPPIHARNLHHLSIVMHDAFAVYQPGSKTILLNNQWHGFNVPFYGVQIPDNVQLAQEIAISYAAFRLLMHRFQNAPGISAILPQLQQRMFNLGLDPGFTSTDYIHDGPAALGNYLAQNMIAYGLQDGSNEQGNFASLYYTDGNPFIEPELPGNPNMVNPNRFQRISLSSAFDQAGNPIFGAPPALAHEWGNVLPFSLKEEDSEVLVRDGEPYRVYFNPGHPPYIDTNIQTGIEDFFKWNFLMVSVWQSHLDTLDNVLWDVSPGSIGNVDISDYPDTWEEYLQFYNFFDGGDVGQGYSINPITNQPYEPQIVRRGDYARVLAEFWADGLDSETPPGHWFKIYNTISQHPLFERKWKGEGNELGPLEFDIKAYVLLGGAMQDAAIAAWAVKGYYDYLRPVSAIRFMGDRGQSSDVNLPNYHPAGLPLIPGYVELVSDTDPLAGANLENLNKIKLYTWRGHDYVNDPHTDMAGVGWILCENWWPYQRPTFVTPPFAGYVSGHSTYSRAAARAMDFITGTPFFPGGMSDFIAQQNSFLEFEVGPSQTVALQWATYYDASDQCSLSRIWGGIHPPIDDIPGRKIGQIVGTSAAEFADSLLHLTPPNVISAVFNADSISINSVGQTLILTVEFDQVMDVTLLPQLFFHPNAVVNTLLIPVAQNWLNNTTCELTYIVSDEELDYGMVNFSIINAYGLNNLPQNPKLIHNQLYWDTKRPVITQNQFTANVINSQTASLCATIHFDEQCTETDIPVFTWQGAQDAIGLISVDNVNSQWLSNTSYNACFNVINQPLVNINWLSLSIGGVSDLSGNVMQDTILVDVVFWDTEQFDISVQLSDAILNSFDISSQALTMTLTSTKSMNTDALPVVTFLANQQEISQLSININNSLWVSNNQCSLVFGLSNVPVNFTNVDIVVSNLFDEHGNVPVNNVFVNQFILDTQSPQIMDLTSSHDYINDLVAQSNSFYLDVVFDEDMDLINATPVVSIRDINNMPVSGISYNIFQSAWLNNSTFRARFNVNDQNTELDNLFARISIARDISGNSMQLIVLPIQSVLDTRNPHLVDVIISETQLNQSTTSVTIVSVFDEDMDEQFIPNFKAESQLGVHDIFVPVSGEWLNTMTYEGVYQILPFYYEGALSLIPYNSRDLASNILKDTVLSDFIQVDFLYLQTAQFTQQDFKVYPNPVLRGQKLQLHLDNPDLLLNYQLLDFSGRTILEVSGEINPDYLQIPSVLASGIYILKVNKIDGVVTVPLQVH